ncbi:MAG: orotate phosphoribosyltransferase [Elusimicrobia bacterium]|nr:orotate phosphoribosyltransferase [Elusimicrobiota bacterium]
MNSEEIRYLFEKYRALLSGHFLLSSGLHSDTYFQSALILQHPEETEKLSKVLAEKITSLIPKIELVVSPALGGIVIGQEMGRVLRARAIFLERVDGKLALRRGFSIEKLEKCLIVEDVITTGVSTKEVIEVIKPLGADIVGVASLVDRSGGKVDFGAPKFSILSLEVKNYNSNECPLCKQGIPLVKPGSRK